MMKLVPQPYNLDVWLAWPIILPYFVFRAPLVPVKQAGMVFCVSNWIVPSSPAILCSTLVSRANNVNC